MPVGTHQQEKRYLSLKDGAFIERIPNSTQTARHGYIAGFLKNITFRDHEKYGRIIDIHLIDATDTFVVSFFWNSNYAYTFCMVLPNLDLTEMVEFEASVKTKDGKTRTELFVKQDGTAIKWYWRKDDQKELPPLVEKQVYDPVKGYVKVWDNSNRLNYLHAMILQSVLPAIEKLPDPIQQKATQWGSHTAPAQPQMSTMASLPVTTGNGTDISPNDDLPF